jgi:hypothetical protein
MEVNMIDINNNNELAKPMAKNSDDIYSNYSNPAPPVNEDANPYDMGQNDMNNNINPVAQKQIIIIDSPENVYIL